jgi:hypothetical protein
MRLKSLSLAMMTAACLTSSLAFAQADPSVDPNQLMVKAMEMAKKADTNHDGMVSQQEWMKMAEERWKMMDKDNKGMVPISVAAKNMLFMDVGAP